MVTAGDLPAAAIKYWVFSVVRSAASDRTGQIPRSWPEILTVAAIRKDQCDHPGGVGELITAIGLEDPRQVRPLNRRGIVTIGPGERVGRQWRAAIRKLNKNNGLNAPGGCGLDSFRLDSFTKPSEICRFSAPTSLIKDQRAVPCSSSPAAPKSHSRAPGRLVDLVGVPGIELGRVLAGCLPLPIAASLPGGAGLADRRAGSAAAGSATYPPSGATRGPEIPRRAYDWGLAPKFCRRRGGC